MKSLLLSLLADPFGLSKENLKVLLQIVEDDEGEAVAEEIEARIIAAPLQLPGQSEITTRFLTQD